MEVLLLNVGGGALVTFSESVHVTFDGGALVTFGGGAHVTFGEGSRFTVNYLNTKID